MTSLNVTNSLFLPKVVPLTREMISFPSVNVDSLKFCNFLQLVYFVFDNVEIKQYDFQLQYVKHAVEKYKAAWSYLS